MMKRGSIVRVKSTGTIAILTDIQEAHNRYQLKNTSGWQYGIDDLELLDNEALLSEFYRLHEEVERMKRGGWISVKERLPLVGEVVWICYQLDDGNQDIEIAYYAGGPYFSLQYREVIFRIEEITHWQPLPKPPKTLEKFREHMHRLAEKHQDLRHPEVVQASQMLDKLILEVQTIQRTKSDHLPWRE